MRICVTTEQRFARSPDGAVWAVAGSPYSFWKRYLQAFDELRVIARVGEVAEPEPAWRRADGDGVSFAPVPYYVGPLHYLRRFPSVRSSLRLAITSRDAVVLRVASTLAASVERGLPRGRPFGLEVVGDPFDVFAPGAVRHPLRPVVHRSVKAPMPQSFRDRLRDPGDAAATICAGAIGIFDVVFQH